MNRKITSYFRKRHRDILSSLNQQIHSGSFDERYKEYVRFYFHQGIGPWCFLVINIHEERTIFISEEAYDVLSIEPLLDPCEMEPFVDHVDPKDYEYIASLIPKISQTITSRLQHSTIVGDMNLLLKGGGRRMMFQIQLLDFELGLLGDLFVSLTDINHLKGFSQDLPPDIGIYDSISDQHFSYLCEKDLFVAKGQTLTNREEQIIRQYLEGNETNTIAENLSISPFTVQTHRINAMKKTKCKTKAELLHFVSQNQLV